MSLITRPHHRFDRGRPIRRMRVGDVFGQAISQPTSKPGRSLLTSLGTVLGVGLLVTIVGLTTTTQSRINTTFNSLLPTEVDAQATNSGGSALLVQSGAQRARQLNGVVASGTIQEFATGVIPIAAGPSPGQAASAVRQGSSPPLIAASAGAFGVVGARLRSGRRLQPPKMPAARGSRYSDLEPLPSSAFRHDNSLLRCM